MSKLPEPQGIYYVLVVFFVVIIPLFIKSFIKDCWPQRESDREREEVSTNDLYHRLTKREKRDLAHQLLKSQVSG